MPHSRSRIASALIKKKLKFNRILALQGARQTGKSFLAREILANEIAKSVYVSLDSKVDRKIAEESPDTFLQMHQRDGRTVLMIDEAQKAPSIFDALKLVVDQNPKPGLFILLGSTEFSREIMVRESLTGRLGRVRIFPMSYKELCGSKKSSLTRNAFLKQLDQGGMPGIAFVRDENERKSLVADWLNLVCFRDLDQFKKMKLDGDVALSLFEGVSVLDHPTLAALSRFSRAPARKVETHLKALVQLLNERFCHHHYAGLPNVKFYFYQSNGRNFIDLIEETPVEKYAFQIFEDESFNGTDFELMKAFMRAAPKHRGIIFAPVRGGEKKMPFELSPWERIFRGI